MKDYSHYCCIAIIILLLLNIGLSIWSLSYSKKDNPSPMPTPTPKPTPKPNPIPPNPTENILLVPQDLLMKVLPKDIVDAYYEAGNKVQMGIKIMLNMGKKDEVKKLTMSWYKLNEKLYGLIKNPKPMSQQTHDQLLMIFSYISKLMDLLINKNPNKENYYKSEEIVGHIAKAYSSF